MAKYYDGEKLREEIDKFKSTRRTTQEEIAGMARRDKRTLQRLTEPGVRKINSSVRSLIEALEISEERIYPNAGLRTIDSAEFLALILLLFDALRIDVDVLSPPRNKTGPDPITIKRVQSEIDEAADQLYELVLKRQDYERNDWEDSVQKFWNKCAIRRISFAYKIDKYELVRPEVNAQFSAIAGEGDSIPVTRIMGQIFLLSHGFRKRVGEISRASTRMEWVRYLFPDIHQDYVPLRPERDVLYVKWEGRILTASNRRENDDQD